MSQRWNAKDKELLNIISKAIKSVMEHYDIEHKNYIKLVSKVTENSNMAIRNAIQNGHYDNLASLNKLQEKFQREKEQYIKAQRDKFDEYDGKIKCLQRENKSLDEQKEELIETLRKHEQDKNDAVDKALLHQK